MPQRLKQRQEKIQDIVKNIPLRDMVKYSASWKPVMFYKIDGEISRYHDKTRISNIISSEKFLEQRFDLPFVAYENTLFDSLAALLKTVPFSYLMEFASIENCAYADCCFGAKNCYLTVVAGDTAENILYSYQAATNVTNIFNAVSVFENATNVYYGSFVSQSYNVFYSRNIHNSSDIWCSNNLQGCKECVLCDGLENQSYCVQNQQYSKEEYHVIKKKFLQHKTKFLGYYQQLKSLKNFNSTGSTGSGMMNCQEVEDCIFTTNLSHSKNVILGGVCNAYNFVNSVDVGINAHDVYATISAGNESAYLYFSGEISECTQLYYSYFMENCSYCLGCIGLKNKSYCILNKQYTKEERYDKVDAIFTQMEKDGTLGKFFPGSMNPFYFNDTAAYLIDDSFTKEEVEAEGYLRRDEKIKVDIPEDAEIVYVGKSHPEGNEGSSTHKIDSSLRSEGQLDHYQGRKVGDKFYPISEIGNKVPKVESGAERWIDPEILKKVIQDKEGNYYKIVKMEYDFLMKHGLPLPKLHWLDRIKLGFMFK